MHANARAVERVTPQEVREALGAVAEGWPSVSLVAVQPRLSRAVFVMSDPLAHGPASVALHNWADGTTVLVDPCSSPVSSAAASLRE